MTSTAALTTKRRDIARILTILSGRELGLETQAQKSATAEAHGDRGGADDEEDEAKKAKAE